MGGFDQQGLPPGYRLKPQMEISPRGLQELLLDPSRRETVLIVDVRTSGEVEAASIQPCLHVPLHEIESRVEEILEASEGKQVVTLCHHGVRSLKASLFLQHEGIANARSMAGGIEAWASVIDTSVPRYERDGAGVTIIR